MDDQEEIILVLNRIIDHSTILKELKDNFSGSGRTSISDASGLVEEMDICTAWTSYRIDGA